MRVKRCEQPRPLFGSGLGGAWPTHFCISVSCVTNYLGSLARLTNATKRMVRKTDRLDQFGWLTVRGGAANSQPGRVSLIRETQSVEAFVHRLWPEFCHSHNMWHIRSWAKKKRVAPGTHSRRYVFLWGLRNFISRMHHKCMTYICMYAESPILHTKSMSQDAVGAMHLA